jgi:hypothetical protein
LWPRFEARTWASGEGVAVAVSVALPWIGTLLDYDCRVEEQR